MKLVVDALSVKSSNFNFNFQVLKLQHNSSKHFTNDTGKLQTAKGLCVMFTWQIELLREESSSTA